MRAAMKAIGGLLALAALLAPLPAGAQASPSIEITVQGGKFVPNTITAPPNTRITIVIKNLDNKAMEFESVALRVEKIIPANGTGSVNVRALAAGSYEFFDDLNPSNRGTLVVK